MTPRRIEREGVVVEGARRNEFQWDDGTRRVAFLGHRASSLPLGARVRFQLDVLPPDAKPEPRVLPVCACDALAGPHVHAEPRS